jgi:hypothetical protein
MFAQGIPDPRSRSFNLLVAPPKETTALYETPVSKPYSITPIQQFQTVKLSKGAVALQLSR